MTIGSDRVRFSAAWARWMRVMGGSAGRILLAAVAMIPAAGLAQTISVNDGTLSFGPQPLGTTSSARLLLVTNSGSAALDITAVTLAGLNDQSFTYPPSTTCIGSLAVAQECSISIAFTPHKVGSLTTRIQIASNATNASSGYSYIDVSGTGVSPTPTVTVSPMSLSFGDEVTGIPSLPQILTVTNTTAGSAAISSVGLYGNNNQASFSSPQLSTSCAGALPVEAQCTISLSFMPRATGPLSTEVSIVSQPGHGAIIIPVSGTGVSRTLDVTVSPASLSFGNQPDGTSSPPQVLTVTNTTARSVAMGPVMLYGNNNQASFGMPPLSTTCTGALAVEAQCTVTVTFTPKSFGPLASIVSIASNPGGTAALIPLSGIGVRAKYAYVSDNIGGTVFGFSSGPTGALTALAVPSTIVALTAGTSFPSSVILTPILGEALVDPSGNYLYVVDQGDNVVWGFAINQSNGALTPVPASPFYTGEDPDSLAFDSTGSYLYVANQQDGSLSAYALDKSTGELSATGTFDMGAMGQLGYAVPAQMVRSGSYLYVADEGDSVVDVFQIAGTGALVEQQNYPTDTTPYSIAVNPAGTVLYTANCGASGAGFCGAPGGGTISAFTITATSGVLDSLSSNPQAIPVSNHIAIDAQGKYLLVTESGGIAVYSFAATGAAAGTLAAVNSGTPVAVGDDPYGPYSVHADPTDQTLYVGSANGAAITGPLTGYLWELTFDSSTGALANVPGETTTGIAAGWNPLFVATD